MRRLDNVYLLTVEPYVRKEDIRELVQDFRQVGLQVQLIPELSREGELIVQVLDQIDELEFTKLVRTVQYISHIVKLTHVLTIREIESMIKACSECLQEALSRHRCTTFKVVAKRLDKSFKYTSVDLCKIIGAELTRFAKVNVVDPDCYIYVEVRQDIVLIGYSLREMFVKCRPCIPEDVISKIVAVVYCPTTLYEIMDIVQLVRALRLQVRVYDPEERGEELIQQACEKLGVSRPSLITTCKDVSTCLDGTDVRVVLSQYAAHGETLLFNIARSVLKRGKTLCLVLGNEYDDPELRFRRESHYEVRLGPCTGQAMRTTSALAYALGVILTAWSV